jgi:hypothetical protein
MASVGAIADYQTMASAFAESLRSQSILTLYSRAVCILELMATPDLCPSGSGRCDEDPPFVPSLAVMLPTLSNARIYY